jgi:hypothetical protein
LSDPAPPLGKAPDLTETWFAGVHSDVVGGFDEGPELGRVSLRWMVEGAIAAGLLVQTKRYHRRYPPCASDANGPVHAMGPLWALAGYRRRPVPPPARVHASVRQRIIEDPAYAARIPTDVVSDDGA